MRDWRLDPVARGGRDAAILESLGLALDLLTKARAREGAKLAALLTAQGKKSNSWSRKPPAGGSAAGGDEGRLQAQIKDLLDGGAIPRNAWRRKWPCWR